MPPPASKRTTDTANGAPPPRRPAIVCVHQMGKVGSTSVVATLETLLPGRKIYQTHVLSEAAITASISQWLTHPKMPRMNPPHNLRSSIELSHQLEYGPSASDWYVLSLVREPLGRNISAFFENLERHWTYHLTPVRREECRELLAATTSAEDAGSPELVAELIALFKACYPHRLFDDWFDREVRDVFGIDVFATPFPVGAGFQILQLGTVRLLLARLEDLNRVFDQAVREWLRGSALESFVSGCGAITLSRANDASAKRYQALYKAFLREFSVGGDGLLTQYASRAAQHFYSERELDDHRMRWKTDA